MGGSSQASGRWICFCSVRSGRTSALVTGGSPRGCPFVGECRASGHSSVGSADHSPRAEQQERSVCALRTDTDRVRIRNSLTLGRRRAERGGGLRSIRLDLASSDGAVFADQELGDDESTGAGLRESMRRSVGLVLLPFGLVSEDRCRSYSNWFEETVLQNLRVGNWELIREALSSLCSAIAERGDEGATYGHAFLKLLPESTRRFVLRTFPDCAFQWPSCIISRPQW